MSQPLLIEHVSGLHGHQGALFSSLGAMGDTQRDSRTGPHSQGLSHHPSREQGRLGVSQVQADRQILKEEENRL